MESATAVSKSESDMAVDFCWVFVEELLPWKNKISLDILWKRRTWVIAVLLTCESLVCKGWECGNEGVDRVSCADVVGG